jgi:hypothetical protein
VVSIFNQQNSIPVRVPQVCVAVAVLQSLYLWIDEMAAESDNVVKPIVAPADVPTTTLFDDDGDDDDGVSAAATVSASVEERRLRPTTSGYSKISSGSSVRHRICLPSQCLR